MAKGLLTVLAEAQRQRRREEARRQRAWETAHQQQQQAYRAAQRAAASGHKAAVAAYQNAREAEATRRTEALEHQVKTLREVLAAGAAAPVFHLSQLKMAHHDWPFVAGPLGHPVVMPDQARYRVRPLSALRSITPSARREQEEQEALARSRFEHDWHAAQAAEADRRRQLADLHRQHVAWAADQHHRTTQHNMYVDGLGPRLRSGEPAAVAEYFAAMLSAAPGWPSEFPRRVATAWDPEACQLVLDWQLPGYDVVPEISRIRYVKTTDEYKEIALPAGQRAALYRTVIAQSCLRVVADVFRSDHLQQVQSVALNGYVRGRDSATGQESDHCLVTAMISRDDLREVQLTMVDAVDCLSGLRGQISPRPERMTTIRPGRRPESIGGAATEVPEDNGTDLYEMDPVDFENLVADLFRQRGLAVMTTQRSGDEGVDVIAEDPDPITGGLIVIQVKRYRATVSPSVVRDLYGVVQHRGATKGILVTTSGFGPGSHEFARGKPLTLIGGAELVQLLAGHALPGRLR